MFRYILFLIAAFFYIVLAIHTDSKPPSNEYGVGYHWGTFFLVTGFAISGLILTIIIVSTGGLDWVSPTTCRRITLVLLYWLFIVLTIFYCAHFKWEWHTDKAYPEFLHGLARSNGQLWIPLLWLVPCFLSLHAEWQSTLSPYVFKVPFWLGLTINTLFICGLLIGYTGDSLKKFKIKMTSRTEQQERWHQIKLNEIAANKPEDPIINLLAYANRDYPDDIRKAALTRIKDHPEWEAELLKYLKNKNAYREVYYFLDGNQVEHPQQFIEPLKESIAWLAATIKDDIENSNNLPQWSYDMYGIREVLGAIDDQFQGQGVDFYSTIVKLKQALTTTPPERFKGVHFNATDVVNRWLKKHKK